MWNAIANGSAIASLLGVSALSFLNDAYKSHLALGLFALALAFLTYRGYVALRGWQERIYPNGCLPIATFVRYSTSDGKTYFYEIFRHIQIKEAYKKSFKHRFFWTGSKEPIVSSLLQTASPVTTISSTNESEVELSFKEHRFYNDTEIVHVGMQIDDSDEKAQTFVCAAVHAPMRLLHFRVQLAHYNSSAHYSQCATLESRAISANENSPFTPISTVKFDAASKSFEAMVPHPHPGNHYRLKWDRLSTRKRAQKNRSKP